jgi:hypothetical protein
MCHEEEDTCVRYQVPDIYHMRRRIHVSYEEEDTCVRYQVPDIYHNVSLMSCVSWPVQRHMRRRIHVLI